MRKKDDVNTVLTTIINAAKQYENVLNKRHFCIVYKKKDTY